jgi:ribosomal protein S18 acetylase RimI-like enzyme
MNPVYGRATAGSTRRPDLIAFGVPLRGFPNVTFRQAWRGHAILPCHSLPAAPMLIRPFEPADIDAAADLLRRAAETFILHESAPEHAAAFLAQHDAAGLGRNLDAGFVYHAAVVDGALAGFIGVRGATHLFHLFVDAAYQRRGIARALWRAARTAALQPGHPGVFTVNASNLAVPFYASLGFERTAPMQADTVPYNPMRRVEAGSVSLVGAA